ncbi:MAG: 4Fe-4S dicluster domain-containing protein [Deltaproteobacteria bacterium]|nr:4Fe-4S dicluster domain-containing protein [Deltaproteobacteria bacterium]
MGINRRDFIKLAGLSALLGLGGKSAFELVLPGEVEAAEKAKPAAEGITRWAMVVDMRKMNDQIAAKCIEACHSIHNVPNYIDPPDPKLALPDPLKQRWQIKWIWTDLYEHAFPGMEQDVLWEKLHAMNFLLLCNHCNNPPCVRVCPTKATYQRPDGIVMMDMHRCIGCRFCMAGCPYGVRSFNWRDPRPYIAKINEDYPTREIGVVEKCLFCNERLAQGLQPACVEASGGALTFGNLADAKSKVREVLKEHFTIRRKPHLGTNPQVYYIV